MVKTKTTRKTTNGSTIKATDTFGRSKRNSPKKSSSKILGETVRHRKVSAKTIAKWQPISPTLQTRVMSMFEDSASRFAGSDNEIVEETLDRIRLCLQNSLKKTKVPKEKWTDDKSLKLAQETLLAEQKRLGELEATLTTTLDKERRQVAQLQTELDRLKEVTDKMDEQLHPLLLSLQEPS